MVNPTSFVRDEPVFLAGAASDLLALVGDGDTVRTKPPEACSSPRVRCSPTAPPSLGKGTGAAPRGRTYVSATQLENAYLRVELNADGDITRIFDKVAGREVLTAGAIANQFQAFEDRPMEWDAWDVDIFFDDKRGLADPATTVKVVEQGRCGPHRDPPAHSSSHLRAAHLAVLQQPTPRHRYHYRLAGAACVAQGRLPGRCALACGNLRNPVGQRAASDAPQHELGLGALRNLRPEVGGPQRRRLWRQRTQRLQVWSRHSRQRDTHQPVARPTMPDPEADQGQHRFAYSSCRTWDWDETTIGAAMHSTIR